jgi:hypothetical protein
MFSLLSSLLGLHSYYVSLPCLLFLSFISCLAHTPLMFTTFSPSQPLVLSYTSGQWYPAQHSEVLVACSLQSRSWQTNLPLWLRLIAAFLYW